VTILKNIGALELGALFGFMYTLQLAVKDAVAIILCLIECESSAFIVQYLASLSVIGRSFAAKMAAYGFYGRVI